MAEDKSFIGPVHCAKLPPPPPPPRPASRRENGRIRTYSPRDRNRLLSVNGVKYRFGEGQGPGMQNDFVYLTSRT